MPESIIQFLCIFLGFAIGTLWAGKAMRKCIELKLYNEVNERSSHKTPTPRGGGYYFSILTSLFALIWLHIGEPVPYQSFIITLILSSLAVAYLGWLDDKYTLSAKVRLLGQFTAVGLCTYMFPQILPEYLPLWAEKVLIVFAWVWFVNLYNFMDGIDGITAVQTAFIALFLSMIIPELASILLVLLGSVLGILRFNWHPARVFMGDVGSTYLGFILAGFMFYSLTINVEGGIWASLAISAIYILDTTYTLIKRAIQGKKPWQAHREHFYQRATLVGLGHNVVVRRIMLLNILFMLCAIIAFTSPYTGPYIFAFVCIVCGFVALRIRYLEGGQ